MLAVRRIDFAPTKHSRLCSQHFTVDSFFTKNGRRYLKEDAVPTLFDLPPRLLKSPPSRPRRPLSSIENVPLQKTPTDMTRPSTSDNSAASAAVQRETVDAQDLLLVSLDKQAASTDVQRGTTEAQALSAMSAHNYSLPASPRALKRKIVMLEGELDSVKKRFKAEKERRATCEKKVARLQDTIKSLQKDRLLQQEAEGAQDQKLGPILAALVKRIKSSNGKPSRRQYEEDLRMFAVTMHYQSPKCYGYVRKTAKEELPHPKTIVRWYGNLECDPGFTQQAFDILKEKVEAKGGSRIHVCLSFDEMAIKKQITWSGRDWAGFTDLGAEIQVENRPLAKDALVFLVADLKEKWKVTVAYFLVAGMSGKDLARLVTIALEKLYDVGVVASSVTCDGPKSHFAMFEELGADFDVWKMVAWFPHPSNPELRVFIMFDPCHMLKLIRNHFATANFLIDDTGRKIEYRFIQELFRLQEEEGLRLGNKLKKKHRMWYKMKMRVGVAAQLLSSSTADSLDMLREDLKLPQFQGSEATSRFLRVFDTLFDLCNSRNPFAPGWKASLKKETKHHWESVLTSTYDYIIMLKDSNGVPMYSTQKKTPFVGFCAVIHSLIGLFEDLVETGELDMLNTYRFLQDHIELYFGHVRLRFGSNNNPNAVQFKASYKRLLVHHDINSTCLDGNCTALDTTRMLTISSVQKKSKKFLDPHDNTFLEDFDLNERAPVAFDHDYCDAPAVARISAFKEVAVTYISGYVVRMIMRMLKCQTCKMALLSDDRSLSSLSSPALLRRKDKGGLIIPSEEVEFICHQAEIIFSQMLKVAQGIVPEAAHLQLKVAIAVMEKSFEKRP